MWGFLFLWCASLRSTSEQSLEESLCCLSCVVWVWFVEELDFSGWGLPVGAYPIACAGVYSSLAQLLLTSNRLFWFILSCKPSHAFNQQRMTNSAVMSRKKLSGRIRSIRSESCDNHEFTCHHCASSHVCTGAGRSALPGPRGRAPQKGVKGRSHLKKPLRDYALNTTIFSLPSNESLEGQDSFTRD